MEVINQIISFLSYSFVQKALLTGTLIAIMTSLIGNFLVIKRQSGFADALSHVSLLGIAMGLIFGFDPIVASIATVVASGILLSLDRKTYQESNLVIIITFSLACVSILTKISGGFKTALFSYLFGSLLTISQTQINWIIGIFALTLAVITKYKKQLLFISFDIDLAKISGINTKFISIILAVLSSLVISISVQVIGSMLISAMVVIPVLTSWKLKQSFQKTLYSSTLLSIISVWIGLFASYVLDLPPSAVIVIINLVLYTIIDKIIYLTS